MRKTLRFTLTAAAVVGLSAVTTTATANATPGSGVTSVTILDKTIGTTEYVVKEITIAPGGSTGWHYHPGMVSGIVRQGVLTHNESNCSIDGIYHVGQRVTEESGPGYVHIGRNLGSSPMVLDVLYQNPVGSQLAVDVPNPGCPFE